MAKVLIVDDSKTSRRILKGILEGCGHEVIAEAENGDEGFIKYREVKPDIVTM
ncbi:MAG: response regulator, partial [Lachnospiraceae bacterium]|nr:response regulator [Lachnospiraceae bacterium]